MLISPLVCCLAFAQTSVNLVPWPRKVTVSNGSLAIASLRLYHPKSVGQIADHYQTWLRPYTAKVSRPHWVRLVVDRKRIFNDEGYRLKVNSGGVVVVARSQAGLFYGLQSLRQLTKNGKIPFVSIEDAPRFTWRGGHLDVSRHFFDKTFVKRYIDLLAFLKLNTFHWHLVDGPGWRIEIKKYPRLTDVGAWRVDKRNLPWNWQQTEISPTGNVEGAYGGFYTQDDIREIVRYAKDRFVRVVPEIEMPGHSYAALIAYPELACSPETIRTNGLHGEDTFCAGNEGTFRFLQDVLTEVVDLFPEAPYIHVGGDEVSPVAWAKCPSCQKKMNELGIRNPASLQPYFMNRIGEFLASKGKKMMGWDEIAGGPLREDAGVMVWRDARVVKDAISKGNAVVMCPASRLYFDHAQTDPKTAQPSAGGMVPLERVYTYEPVDPSIPMPLRKLVLGVQSCLWTEQIQTPEYAEYMLLPRMSAMAEVAWTPQTKRDLAGFKRRLPGHLMQLKKLGYRPFEAGVR